LFFVDAQDLYMYCICFFYCINFIFF